MPEPIILVQDLSKRYRIGGREARQDTLAGAIVSAAKRPFGNLRRLRRLSHFDSEDSEDVLWALRDISFDVAEGEVVGIVGRNGAGKSTLLKVLSRITSPTSGRVVLAGRVASLLEVGTGFHPELTGRENVYLNGTILGMRKSEVDAKLEEIIDFSGIERFIDTPLKRYSSGMAVRLAFSVAAHLEPEILLIDEVLAVGDAEFRKKCLGKMRDVADQGRTVLFVSHNLSAVSNLCERALLLEQGRVVKDAESSQTVEHYLRSGLGRKESAATSHVLYRDDKADPSEYAITRVELLDQDGQPRPMVSTGDTCVLRVRYWSPQPLTGAAVELHITTLDGTRVLAMSTQPDGTFPLDFDEGAGTIDCSIDRLPLAAGQYVLGGGLTVPYMSWLFVHDNLATLEVHPSDVYGSGLAPQTSRSLVALDHHWSIPGAHHPDS